MNINDTFPSNYIKASDLNGHVVPVVISHVAIEEVGRSKDEKAIVYFTGKEKGLVLNKTNANKIIALTGTAETDEWAGHTIALYPTETEFGGEQVECVRIKAATPKGAPPVAAPRAKPAKPTKAAPEPVTPASDDLDEDAIPF